jgi:hypothetical protein
MNKLRAKELLVHPIFISLIIWAVLILFIPPFFFRYRIKHIKDEYPPGKVTYLYHDLDSDGRSERISFDFNDMEQTKIIISINEKVIDQYDLRYQPVNRLPGFFEDFNNDSYKELYVFTMNQDSIFLNIIDPLKSRKTILADRFIDIRKKAQKSTDIPQPSVIGLINRDNSDSKDVLFYINTGYSRQPRNVYKYLINEDSLLKSPESGVVINGCLLYDINRDSINEVLLDVLAAGNLEVSFQFSDQHSWLMILDKDLRFVFPPVKLGDKRSRVQVLPIQNNNQTNILVFHEYFGNDNILSYFCIYDINGNKLYQNPVRDYVTIISKIFPGNNLDKQNFFFLMDQRTRIAELNSLFQIKRTISIPGVSTGEPIAVIDADMDGKKEYIFHGYNKRSLIITKNDFRFPVTWEYNSDAILPLITQYFMPGEKPNLFLQFSDQSSYIRYEKNPFFYLKLPFYIGIYLALYFFILAIAHLQQYRLKMVRENEIKMASLQMKAIKNQIDPHFTLNVLNAIGSLYSDENNRERADYIFGKYAKLIRQTVISSDKINVTIDEELDFVKNYIEIERFRSNNSFDYFIRIDPNTNTATRIPRMLIHTFVENAIKYGVRGKSEGGQLVLDISTDENAINISVEDNGPGLELNGSIPKGTGKGLNILTELIELYFKLENVKIAYSLENIIGKSNKVAGTKALILIPLKRGK